MGKWVRIICSLLFLLALFFMVNTPGAFAAGADYLIKFATVAPEGSTWITQMEKLDKELRQKTEGRLGFRIYAGGVAGDEIDVLKKIRIGQIHCAAFSGVGFGQILPMVRVLDLPFLFRNEEDIDRVHKEMKEFFAIEFRKTGFELLSWAEVGNVHVFSKEPIHKVKDFEGLKVWTWSGDPIAQETFRAMGISPIPLPFTDVTTAINTGMIDTVYAPPLGALALQWHTYMNYMTSLPLVHSTGALLISLEYFEKIPEEYKAILKTTVNEEMAQLTEKLRGQNDQSISLIEKSGVKIIPRPQGKELEEFYSIHDRVAQRLAGRIYPEKVLNQVYEILKQTRNR